MANIWIINPFDNLSAEGARPQRYELLAREFVRRGNGVVYWTSSFSHAMKKRRARPDGTPLSSEFKSEYGIDFRLIETKPYDSNLSFARISNHRQFARKFLAAARLADKPTLAIVSVPPISILAAVRELGMKYVLDVQDAWPDVLKFAIPAPFRRIAWDTIFAPPRAIMGKACKGASLVTATGRSFVDFAKSYGATAPSRVFYLGVPDVAESLPVPSPGPLRLAYSGNLGRLYDLATVIDAVKRCVADGVAVRLDIAGAGANEPSLRRRAGGCDFIEFHGYLGSDEQRRLLRSAHIGVIPMIPESLVAVPNKLFDYAASGLAILNSLPGETSELVSSNDIGVQYSCHDAASLADAIKAYAAGSECLARHRANALGFAKSKCVASAIYPRMCDFIEGVL